MAFKLVKEIPAPVRSGNGGGRAAQDIAEMVEALAKHPTQTLHIAGVWNPGRFYDGLRKHGLMVKVRATGAEAEIVRLVKGTEVKETRPLFDVYAYRETTPPPAA